MTSARTHLPAATYKVLSGFRRAVSRYDRLSERHIRQAGLTPQQYALLLILGGAGDEPPSIGAVADALSITHNSAVGLTQRAERAGLLRRVSGPSRRQRTLLHLTDEGARTLDAATGALIASLNGERLELLEALTRWRGLLQSGRFAHPPDGEAAPAYDLAAAGSHERGLVWQLLQLHLYELSVFHGGDTDEGGEYPYESFDAFWRGEGHASYLVRVSVRPAGFALVRRRDAGNGGPPWHDLAEFCILRRHRGHHLGARVAGELIHARPGRWSVAFHEHNLTARAFWGDVVRRHAVGGAREEWLDDPRAGTRLTFEVARA